MDPSVPPGPNTSLAVAYLVSSGVLAVIALSLCGARVYTRYTSKADFRADDYTIIAGTVSHELILLRFLRSAKQYTNALIDLCPRRLLRCHCSRRVRMGTLYLLPDS